MPWRAGDVMRAYCRYLLQTGLPFSQGYIAQVLANSRRIARLLADLFVARFDPRARGARRAARRQARQAHPAPSLEAVTRSDEDRILRALVERDRAPPCAPTPTSRTPAGQPKDYLSFKIESQQLRELPLPRPLFEIFVFSPRMEGVHLRMGHVARGGIRWSDRREDFRTEVLGPDEGAAGQEHRHRAGGRQGRLRAEAAAARPTARRSRPRSIACYQTLIRGMLDLTDNIVDDRIAAAAAGGALRRRRSLPRGRRRQGHGDLLRHRQCAVGRIRLLARRRVRLGRLGRL